MFLFVCLIRVDGHGLMPLSTILKSSCGHQSYWTGKSERDTNQGEVTDKPITVNPGPLVFFHFLLLHALRDEQYPFYKKSVNVLNYSEIKDLF